MLGNPGQRQQNIEPSKAWALWLQRLHTREANPVYELFRASKTTVTIPSSKEENVMQSTMHIWTKSEHYWLKFTPDVKWFPLASRCDQVYLWYSLTVSKSPLSPPLISPNRRGRGWENWRWKDSFRVDKRKSLFRTLRNCILFFYFCFLLFFSSHDSSNQLLKIADSKTIWIMWSLFSSQAKRYEAFFSRSLVLLSVCIL